MKSKRCLFCENRSNQGKGILFYWSAIKEKDFICNPCLHLMMDMMKAFKEWAKEPSTRLSTKD